MSAPAPILTSGGSDVTFDSMIVESRAVENAESARSVIYAIFSAHSAYFNVSRQKVPYFNVSRQNRVVFKTVLQQNNVEAC